MTQKLLLILIFCTYTGFAQDSGGLKGVVNDINGKGIPEANIDVQGTGIGTKTIVNGSFEIKNIPVGNYLLRISYIGFKPGEIAISIKPGEITQLPNIILNTAQEELNEIVINGNGNINKFNREKSAYVSKLPLKNIENPQVYDNITSELLKEQIVTNFDDALKK